MKRFGRAAAISIVLAAMYFIAGRLGLLLAIPPGYATAVWPPAGIALTALLTLGLRYWPGIWLGSFVVNVSISPSPTMLLSITVAAFIAVGAVLQAVAGVALIRRYVGFPTALDDAQDVAKFLVLGGPASCLVNASFSVTTLWLAGMIPLSNYVYSWWTWWIGDAIGAVVVCPFILVWMGPPGSIWRRRRVTVAVPLAILFLIFVVMFVVASSWEQKRVHLEFERRAHHASVELAKNFSTDLEALHSVAGLYATAPYLSRNAFSNFVRRRLSQNNRIQAIGWLPRVSDSDRAGFEQAVTADGYSGFQITERGDGDQVVRAAERPEYLPALYIERYDRNKLALGFDVASEPAGLEASVLARDAAEPIASGRIKLVQTAAHEAGIVVLLPIYRGPLSGAVTVDERRRSLVGYVAGFFHIVDLVEASLGDIDATGIAIRIEDVGAKDAERLLYVSPGVEHEAKDGSAGVRWSSTLDLAGRRWSLRMSATPAYLAAHRSLYAWTVLTAGVLFTGLLGALLLVITGYATRAEALVAQRTQELQKEIAKHRETALELIAAKDAADAANRAKSSFLANMSHELRTPLNGIIGFSDLLEQEIFGPLSPRQIDYVRNVVISGRHLLGLVNDILDVSKIEAGRLSLAQEWTSLTGAAESVVDALRPLAVKRGVTLDIAIPSDLPILYIDLGRIRQILYNLLSNGFKFTPSGGTVRLRAEAAEGVVRIIVEDTGIGIRVEDLPRLFREFEQLNHNSADAPEGTGLGLALTRRLVELHGGSIAATSEYGKGSTFTVSLPLLVKES